MVFVNLVSGSGSGRGAAFEHYVEDVASASCQADQGLVVSFALGSHTA